MTHSHLSGVYVSATVTHNHMVYMQTKVCGACSTKTHTHANSTSQGNSHNHSNIVLNFGNAELGSPWQNHTHPITLVSMDNGGAAHNHSVTTNTSYNKCSLVDDTVTHYHPTGSPSIGNSGASHTHGLTGAVTGNADVGGTPEDHWHPFSVNLDVADNHSHSVTGIMNSRACSLGCSHNHTCNTPSGDKAHPHDTSGDSGSGGEAAPTVAEFQGDGLTFWS